MKQSTVFSGLSVLTFVTLAASAAGAEPGAAVRPNYDLFHPVPDERMREMEMDRPDTTETPHTVDAGHFQAETEPVSIAMDRDAAARTRTIHATLAAMNLKVGLLDSADLELIVRPFERERILDERTGTVTSHAYFGDTDVRLKWNVWGNDEGLTAFGFIPYVTLPGPARPGSKFLAGGLVAPLSIQLPEEFDFGCMAEVGFDRTDASFAYEPQGLLAATVGHDLVGDLGGFVELAAFGPMTRPTDLVGTFNGGLIYHLGGTIRLDAGFNIGLTEAADDLRLFFGFSIRR